MSALELPCGVHLLNKFIDGVTMLVLDLLFVLRFVKIKSYKGKLTNPLSYFSFV